MFAAIKVGWKVLRWIIGMFTGDEADSGSALSGSMGGLIPKPLNTTAVAKAKAIRVENKILKAAAELDEVVELEKIKDDIEVKDENNNITGFNFDS